MTRWFWIDGRFAWPFVAVVSCASLILLLADLAWRVLIMPAEALATLVVGLCVIVVLAFIGLRLLTARRRHSS